MEIGDGSVTVSPWFDGERTYYVFLPAYAHTDSVVVEAGPEIRLGEHCLAPGGNLTGIVMDTEYSLPSGKSLVFLQSRNLPALYLDTISGDMEYLRADKNHQEAGKLMLVDADGSVLCRQDLEWISGRGNHSWMLDKRGWGFKLSQAEPLLGMAQAQKWVLLANAYEATHGLRNYLAYKMALETGMEYSSDLRFVDLYLNGQYGGTFLLTERIAVSESRMDIGDLDQANLEANHTASLKPEDYPSVQIKDENGIALKKWLPIRSPEDITGGYILERNYDYKLQDKPCILTTSRSEGFVIRSPEAVSPEELEYIADVVQHVENALFHEDWVDPETGKALEELIDLDSWVRKYLVDETSKNEGAGTTSSYFYKKQGDDLLYAGPVWDYDKSFGYPFPFQLPEGITYSSYHFNHTYWWKQLYQNPKAFALIRQYYQDIFRPYLMQTAEHGLDRWAEEIAASYRMDTTLWKDEYSSYLHLSDQSVTTADELNGAVEYLKTWIRNRIAFLDSVWIDGKAFCTVSAYGIEKSYVIPYGSTLEGILDTDSYTVRDMVTGLDYDITQPVLEDVALLAEPIAAEDTDEMNRTVSASSSLKSLLLNAKLLNGINIIWLIPIGVLLSFFAALIWIDLRHRREYECNTTERDGHYDNI